MIMVETRGLTRTFGALTAVDHLDLKVAKGEVFGLVGPDGAGKTTTLRMLCTLLHPTSGEAFVAGEDVGRKVDSVKDRIGYMAQKFGLYGDLTVEENMLFYADLFGVTRSVRDELMRKLLGMTRMEPFRSRPAAKLSGGMKQKLALMCTLLHKPEILFLDEPTNGVDPVSRRDFWIILNQLVRDGMTVLLTTAYLDEAERCHRVGLMDRGKLIVVDSPMALRESLPQRCVELFAEDLREVRGLVRKLPGVRSADLAGNALHVFLNPEYSISDLKAQVPHAELREILPSLEDVFVATLQSRNPHAST
jgi:ABC-2 type transport system ATP-binding protein